MSVETAAANANYGNAASGSSFYAAMRILPPAQREAMFQIYSFCRQVDDIADSDGPRRGAARRAPAMARRHRRAVSGPPPARLKDYVASVKTFGLKREDFLAIVDGMEMDVPHDIRAPDMATLDLYCDRVASAVGRLSVRVFGLAEEDGIAACASSRPRAATDQHPARHRRGCRARPALSAARRPAACRHHRRRSAEGDRRPALPKVCAPLAQRARDAFRQGRRNHGPQSAPRRARAPHHVEILPRDPGTAARARICRPARAGARDQAARSSPSCSATRSSDAKNRSHHRRRNFRPFRSRAARQCRLATCRSTRRRSRPAAAAAPISTPPPISPSTTAIICCCRAIIMRAPMPARSAPRRGWSGRRARSFRSSISRPASAGSSISATAGCRLGVRRGAPRARYRPARLSRSWRR